MSGNEFTSRALPYAVFSRLLLLFRGSEQIDPSASGSRTSPPCRVTLSLRVHVSYPYKTREKLYFSVFLSLYLRIANGRGKDCAEH
jgi:hypothetical protein